MFILQSMIYTYNICFEIEKNRLNKDKNYDFN